MPADDRAGAMRLPKPQSERRFNNSESSGQVIFAAAIAPALMRFRCWVFRPDNAAFKNMLQHLRRIIAGFDLLIMENFYFNRVGGLHAMSC
jgi:hypothetical protein